MISTHVQIISDLRDALRNHSFWGKKLSPFSTSDFAIHLGIFREPYLTYIMEGKKTVESRFSKRACPPFEKVSDGDVVVLKKSGGDVVGICLVEKAWFYRLDPKSFTFIREKFEASICPADSKFWNQRKEASVATLLLIGRVTPIRHITIQKRDRRGWVVFSESRQEVLLNQ